MFVDKQTNPILCVNIEGKIKVFKKKRKEPHTKGGKTAPSNCLVLKPNGSKVELEAREFIHEHGWLY